MNGSQALRDLLRGEGGLIWLDGAMGTELLRRGVPTPLPLWSAPANIRHAAVVESIHRDYIRAGCRLISTNTFRTSWYVMERQAPDAWWNWNRAAVSQARRASEGRAWVLGSVTTLEDCYRPDLVPSVQVTRRYHRRQIDLLVDLGVDGLLLETFNTLRELDGAYSQARRHDVPVIVSVALREPAVLYDGTPLEHVAHWARAVGPDLFSVNCASPQVLDIALRRLHRSVPLPLGAYANVGQPGGEMGFEFTCACPPAVYAGWCARWARTGIRMLGGCCGTTPEHLQEAIRRADRSLWPTGRE